MTPVTSAKPRWRDLQVTLPPSASDQGRAATDPDAKGGTLYGPLFVSFGPPVVKPLFPVGVAAGIETLWEVSQQETGVALDVPGTAAA